MPQGSALIADQDAQHAGLLSEQFSAAGWRVDVVKTINDLREQLQQRGYTLAIVAMDLGESPCEPTFDDDLYQNVDDVVVMGEQDDPPRVRRIMQQGASYFFCKPFDQLFFAELIQDLNAELEREQAADGGDVLCPIDQFGAMRGSSRAMQRLFRTLRKVAPTDASVLLIGESGTGKELAARTLHQLSARADAPLVAMNCAAIPAELVESELFGHVKGAFTGADREHKGFFERADAATLFLDEITEMPAELQVKLLRVLETGKFRRVGGESDLASDVRIITATNRDPQSALDDGVLREDLYYRVAGFPIALPPLRKRRGDIVGLAQFFLNERNDALGTQVSFTDEALDMLNDHSWPGNVRELKATIERAYVLASGTIDAEHILLTDNSPESDEQSVTLPVGTPIEEAERELIVATLKSFGGDKKAAAETLGISLKTLYNRLNDYEN